MARLLRTRTHARTHLPDGNMCVTVIAQHLITTDIGSAVLIDFLRAGPAEVLIGWSIGDAPLNITYWDVIFVTV